MSTVRAVIGAGYGDEGKGLMTDYLSRITKDPLVVRFNGGAQAGHTVTTPDNRRQVFSHLGSGTLAGAPTYLAKEFIVNPMYYVKEHNTFEISPEIFIDDRCIITTPWDVLINQIHAQYLGSNAHGSCGAGIYETITRNKDVPFSVLDIYMPRSIETMLKDIRDGYCRERLRELVPDSELHRFPQFEYFSSEIILQRFILDCEYVRETSSITPGLKKLKDYSIIMEGAQGLLLDQNAEGFPHLTPSNTGVTNILEFMNEMDLEDHTLEVNYVTRCYTTRHGNGPLPYEGKLVGIGVNDPTNKFNEFQGYLRTAPLDFDRYERTITMDLEQSTINRTKMKRVVTCVDQIIGDTRYVENSELVEVTAAQYIEKLHGHFDLMSYGPTFETIYPRY